MMTVDSIEVVMKIVRIARMYQERCCEQEICSQVRPTCCAQLSRGKLWSIKAMFVMIWGTVE